MIKMMATMMMMSMITMLMRIWRWWWVWWHHIWRGKVHVSLVPCSDHGEKVVCHEIMPWVVDCMKNSNYSVSEWLVVTMAMMIMMVRRTWVKIRDRIWLTDDVIQLTVSMMIMIIWRWWWCYLWIYRIVWNCKYKTAALCVQTAWATLELLVIIYFSCKKQKKIRLTSFNCMTPLNDAYIYI